MKARAQTFSVALTIAGSDSGGAAGIQADLKTFAACGVYGASAIVALTAQNPRGVSAVHAMPPKFVCAQLEQIAAFYPVHALKTGMLATAGIIRAVAAFLAANPNIPSVVDPVMVASSGALLLERGAVRALTKLLLPRAALITPNLDEAAVLLGAKIGDELEARVQAAVTLAKMFSTAVLLKGGHARGGALLDILAGPEGTHAMLCAQRVRGVNTHGGGCSLSAAIAAHLALGAPLETAVRRGHAALQRAFARPLVFRGERFLNHEAMRK